MNKKVKLNYFTSFIIFGIIIVVIALGSSFSHAYNISENNTIINSTVEIPPVPTASDTVISLAINETEVDSANMTQAVIHDTNGDYRYIGADPDNYVTFNGELWRIIGVFNDNTHGKTGEQLVKIIRNDSIGSLSWDYKAGVGSSTSDYGSNDWSDSQLMYMLNGANYLNSGYTTGSTPIHSYTINSSNYITDGTTQFYQLLDGSSYLDGASSVCKPAQIYSGNTFSCTPLSVNGINTSSREMVEEVTWHLGSAESYDASSNGLASHWYSYERGTTVYSGRPTTWVGKIGLMYISDYGYATIGNATTTRVTCLSGEIKNWAYYCYSNDWLFKTTDQNQWVISSHPTYSFNAMRIAGGIYYASTSTGYSVRPTLYLKYDVLFAGGSGTSTDPYQLSYVA